MSEMINRVSERLFHYLECLGVLLILIVVGWMTGQINIGG